MNNQEWVIGQEWPHFEAGSLLQRLPVHPSFTTSEEGLVKLKIHL